MDFGKKSYKKCPKCNKDILEANFVLHEARCPGPVQQNDMINEDSPQTQQQAQRLQNMQNQNNSNNIVSQQQQRSQQQQQQQHTNIVPVSEKSNNAEVFLCPNCQQQFPLEQIDVHEKNCPCRPVQCNYCNQSFPENLLNAHIYNCPQKQKNKSSQQQQQAKNPTNQNTQNHQQRQQQQQSSQQGYQHYQSMQGNNNEPFSMQMNMNANFPPGFPFHNQQQSSSNQQSFQSSQQQPMQNVQQQSFSSNGSGYSVTTQTVSGPNGTRTIKRTVNPQGQVTEEIIDQQNNQHQPISSNTFSSNLNNNNNNNYSQQQQTHPQNPFSQQQQQPNYQFSYNQNNSQRQREQQQQQQNIFVGPFGMPLLGGLGGMSGDNQMGGGNPMNLFELFFRQMQDPSATGGINEEQMDTLPTIKFKKTKTLSEEHLTCAVCQEEFKDDEELKLLPCFHRFHEDCIKPWLLKNSTCPICKQDLNPNNNNNNEDYDEYD